MNFTNNMNYSTNYSNTSFNPFVSMQTQTMPSPCFGGGGGGHAGWTYTQGNNNPSVSNTTSTKLPWIIFPTPMEYEVYETFMDFEYETDMLLEEIGHRLNNVRISINIDDYNLVHRLSHLNIEYPMEVDDDDDDPMDYEEFL